MRKVALSIISAGVATVAAIVPLLVSAQGQIAINPNIPGLNITNTGPCGWVVNFYDYALFISGILAFGAIVYGGVRYASSAGNPSGQSEGKNWIWSSLLGILLLAGAYLILHTINPNLTTCSFPSLSGISVPPVATSTTPLPVSTSTCPMTALAVVTDPYALAMEGGQTVIWTSSDANVQRNLDALQTAFNQFSSLVRAAGGNVSVNSVYRPMAYQAHFYDIYQHATQLNNNPSYANIASCLPIINNLRAEEQKHGICTPGGPCLASAPSACSVHTKGVGIDISVTGMTNAAASALAAANNIPLRWQALASDPVHYNLINPPYSGCAAQ